MEWVADFKWNQWPEWNGMGGRLRVESLAGLVWNMHVGAEFGGNRNLGVI